ncbi:MAG: pentapeptide repeat-containing protein [Oscillatoria sp. SIO1A7]|nr:pentapeptide repeat-containing protein [Oscillatoria sp. SIO1A7]
MRPEAASQYIASFEKRFGKPHLYLAYHAALPLAVTPDLLYSLWANFQRDCQGRSLNIPWVAVANLLLSGLFKEVGYELYEMDDAVKSQLLEGLKKDEALGQKRIIDLSLFLGEYVRQQLYSEDIDLQDFAKAQHWTALAYIQPIQAARELALTFQKQFPKPPLDPELLDKIELARLAAVVETLSEPLSEPSSEKKCQPLLVYARAIASFARDDVEAAVEQFATVAESGKIEVVGLDLPIPDRAKEKLPNSSKAIAADFSGQNLQARSFRGQDLTGANFSKTDIRSADFTNAKLVGADFSGAETGLQRRWEIIILSCSLLLFAVLGIIAAIALITMGVLLGAALPPPAPESGFSLLGGLIIFHILSFVIANLGAIFLFAAFERPNIDIYVYLRYGIEDFGLTILVTLFLVPFPSLGFYWLAIVVFVVFRIMPNFKTLEYRSITGALALLTVGYWVGGIVDIIKWFSNGLEAGFIVIFTIAIGVVFVLLGWDIRKRSQSNDPELAAIRNLAIAPLKKNTSFRGADLTNANFTRANLNSADFRGANLTLASWRHAEKIDRAFLTNSYLQHPEIQKIVTTGSGQNIRCDRLDLRGINLANADLAYASFIDSNLSQANLQGADLFGAELVRTKLDGANLTGARLTGAYIQNWQISETTEFAEIDCDYIYMRYPTEDNRDPDRLPADYRQTFEPGEFQKWVATQLKGGFPPL